MTSRLRPLPILVVLLLTAATVASQEAPLTVIRADPSGELTTLADAGQIRIVFSEPMLAIGAVPDGRAPVWLRMTPAAPGTFYWAGTKTLVFSPDPARRLPYSTKFTIRVDATATSLAGRRLAAPYEIAFTTPTLRLTKASASRKTQRFDSPVVIRLYFNQPVRIEDVLAHTRVSLEPHNWKKPALSETARAYWQANDAAGLQRFDKKVADVSAVASSSDPVEVGVAEPKYWEDDEGDGRAILETLSAPPPEAWLRVTVGADMPAAEGNEPHPPQSKTLELGRALFLEYDGSPSVGFTTPVSPDVLAEALTVSDVTNPDNVRRLPRATGSSIGNVGTPRYTTLVQLGFGTKPPMSRWQLAVQDLQALDGQTLGYSWVGLSSAGHYGAEYGFGGTVFEAGSGSHLPFIARNMGLVKRWLLPVAPRDLVPALANIRESYVGTPLFRTYLGTRPPGPGEDTFLAHTANVTGRHAVDATTLLTNGTGLIWVTADKPRTMGPEFIFPARAGELLSEIVQVTNLGITAKQGPLSTLVFVTRLDTGLPVADATVTIRDEANVALWTGRTAADGIAIAHTPTWKPEGRYSPPFVVTAERDGDIAFVRPTWNRDQAWNSSQRSVPWSWTGRDLRGTVFSDRGAYRRGERVHLKAVLREETRHDVRLLAPGTQLELTVTGPRDEEVVKREVTVNDWSSAEWTFTLPPDAALGGYDVRLSRETPLSGGGSEQSIRTGFLVAAYKTPEFRVTTTLSSEGGLGSPIRGRVEARYLFGSAVGARPVSWSVLRRAISSAPDQVRNAYPPNRYDIGYQPPYRDSASPDRDDFRVERSTLDTNGNLEFTLATSASQPAAYQYSVQANVASASGENIAGRAELVVHPASLFIALSRGTSFVSARDGAAQLSVATVDPDGRPVAGTDVELTLLRRELVPATGDTQETPINSWSVTTTSTEVPVRVAIPHTGSYTLRATARDPAGRQTRTDSQFYAIGPERPSWGNSRNQLELVPERETWKPGETARILIQSPWERATALLTVERAGIRRHRTFTVRSMQDTIDVPISEEDVPNVFVSVVLVKGRTGEPRAADGTDPGKPATRTAHVELKVDSASRRLRVVVAADRQAYRPGQEASVGVTVAGPDNRPSPSEVTFWAVDEGVLALTGYALPDVVEAIHQPKPLEVITSDNRDRLRMSLENGSSTTTGPFPVVPRNGPPHVDVSSALQRQIFRDLPGFGRDATRKDFRPVAFWLGSMMTGLDGRGRTTVRLPDSLTAYRIMAIASDRASRFGSGELEIRATKPLTLLPALPRFLVAGDSASFGATVTYAGTTATDAVISIDSHDPSVVRFGTPARRLIRLEPGTPQLVTFDAVAGMTGTTRVRVTVRAGEETDAFELPLPVTTSLRPQITAAYGTVSANAAQEGLVLPAGARTDQGALTIELASTALVGLGESARYVTDSGHNSAEQRASRALVYLLSSTLDGAYGLSRATPATYREAAEAELRALVAHQCDGGSFSLFPEQCEGSPYLSAYVVHVLRVAQGLGINVGGGAMLQRALANLTDDLQRPHVVVGDYYHEHRAAAKAYTAKVLAEAGQPIELNKIPILTSLETLPVFGLSFLADAFHAQRDHGPQYQSLLRHITNALRVTADRVHVEERDESALGWMFLDNVGSTAIVLEGLARRGDAPELVVPLVRWLMGTRRNGHWGQTHTNARTLEALVAYYSAHETDPPDMTATAAIGTKRVARTAFKDRSSDARQVVIPMTKLLEHIAAGASPPLIIGRDGTGTVHYTARLQTYVREDAAAFDRGFAVERSYELFTASGKGTAATTFAAGDVIRVRVRLTLRGDGQYLAVTDPLPAGFEAIDEHFETTARGEGAPSSYERWRNWAFDHVEKHDDRVLAYATHLESGTHELTYLVRAMTAGTFSAAGATVEAMYTPEWSGRSAAATVRIR